MTSQEKLGATRQKALESLQHLEKALSWLDAEPLASDRWGRLDATAKRFEVSFEYVWKAFKAALEHQGEEVYGPRDSITLAATYQWIDDVEEWAEFLQARNVGVHDYFGLSSEEYAEIARRFLKAAYNILQRLSQAAQPTPPGKHDQADEEDNSEQQQNEVDGIESPPQAAPFERER